MHWLYRLQQRLSITRNEATAVLTLSLLFFVGLAVRAVQQQPPSFDPSIFEQSQALLAAGTASPYPIATVDTSVVPQDTVHAGKDAAGRHRIDINTAGSDELQRLPRIGPAMASRIIEYRERRGPFRSVEELLEVRGIGQKTLAGLAPLVTVEKEGP